jgi:hypothetical protein
MGSCQLEVYELAGSNPIVARPVIEENEVLMRGREEWGGRKRTTHGLDVVVQLKGPLCGL